MHPFQIRLNSSLIKHLICRREFWSLMGYTGYQKWIKLLCSPMAVLLRWGLMRSC